MRTLDRCFFAIFLTIFIGMLTVHSAISGMMTDHKPGYFSGIDGHDAAGHAEIGHNVKGQAILTIHEAEIDRVPDGRVYLTHSFDHRNGVELGKLTSFSGTLTFAVPASVTLKDYDSVVIWCKQFDVGIGKALLGDMMTKK